MSSILSNIFNKKWTISDIYNTDYSRQMKSSSCYASFTEVFCELKRESIVDKFKRFFVRNKQIMNLLYVIFKFSVTSDSGHTYNVYIRTQYDPEMRLYMRNEVEIYCECHDFKFNSAWTLNQHSALFKSERSVLNLGVAITNAPKKKKGTILCKHAYAALTTFVQSYSSYMSYV